MSEYYYDPRNHAWAYQPDFLEPEEHTRPLGRRRRPSKDNRDDQRPRLSRNFYSDIEPIGHPTVDPAWDSESDQDWQLQESTRRTRGQPPKAKAYRKRIPSPEPLNHDTFPVPAPMPPAPFFEPERPRIPSPPAPRQQISWPESPDSSSQFDVPVKPKPSRRKNNNRRPSIGQLPVPMGFDQRRHSDMDVTLRRSEHFQDTPLVIDPRQPRPSGGVHVVVKSRGDRVQNIPAPAPLAVPGSFPSTLDAVQPDDSRSETSVPKRVPSSDPRFSASSLTLRPSISPSVSGILGDNVYRYKQLGPLQFRLIKILPKTMSLIKCELVHYSLEDPPKYIAISYAWGDSDDKRRIQLDGADIPVAASLHGALFALRAKRESVLVWVDALSIDQQNKDERTQQVQLMTQIYSRAVSVAIWLGPEADESNTAIKTLNEVAAEAHSEKKIVSLMSSKAGKAHFAAIVALFSRPYWSRLWVVQEVFNAKDIKVYCGTVNLPWTAFRVAANVFLRHRGQIEYFFPGEQMQDNLRAHTFSQALVYHGPNSIPDVSSFHGLGEESLLEVMRICRRKLAADPKDKLYGILGLLEEDIREEFPADYSLSVKEVYVRVFDYLLCTTELLDVLCEAVHFPLHTNSDLPTWVPDWSHNPETVALARSGRFSAARSTKADAKVLDDRRRLEITAIYLDTISEHGIAVGTLCTLADYLMAFIHWRALLLSSEKYDESQARQEEFCRTLSLGQRPKEWKGPWRNACFHVFASLIRDRIPRLPLDSELVRYIDAAIPIEPDDRRRFLQEHFGSKMMGRCFCITEDGSIGMGSGFMTAGDIVVIPLGCSTPVLLRQEGPRGEYRYVGDVYIHGYMQGAAVDHWKSGEREVHQYVIH